MASRNGLIVIFPLAVFLFGGCSKQVLPTANVTTCADEKLIASLKNGVEKDAFLAECQSFKKAADMQKWEFKKSPPDKF